MAPSHASLAVRLAIAPTADLPRDGADIIMGDKAFYVYIITNKYNTVLYTGVTNNLQRRVLEHKSGKGSRFTSRYGLTKLVFFETTDDIHAAIAREKQIKAGSRRKKIALIEIMNPEWKDLFEEHFA